MHPHRDDPLLPARPSRLSTVADRGRASSLSGRNSSRWTTPRARSSWSHVSSPGTPLPQPPKLDAAGSPASPSWWQRGVSPRHHGPKAGKQRNQLPGASGHRRPGHGTTVRRPQRPVSSHRAAAASPRTRTGHGKPSPRRHTVVDAAGSPRNRVRGPLHAARTRLLALQAITSAPASPRSPRAGVGGAASFTQWPTPSVEGDTGRKRAIEASIGEAEAAKTREAQRVHTLSAYAFAATKAGDTKGLSLIVARLTPSQVARIDVDTVRGWCVSDDAAGRTCLNTVVRGNRKGELHCTSLQVMDTPLASSCC